MDLDELLEDLQTVLPEVQAKRQAASGSAYDALPDLPGTNIEEYHRYYEPPTSPGGSNSSGSQPLDDQPYSEVRHGPRYVPKSRDSAPPPAKPKRTDRPEYDSMVQLKKAGGGSGGGGGEYASTKKSGGGGAGLSELDNLLAMLSDTQKSQESHEVDLTSGRPTVADFMDELTEVEKQVSGQSPGPVSPHSTTPESGRSRPRLTASTATQELDDLMATLSDFKMPPTQTIPEETPYSKPNRQKAKSQATNELDSMLVSLQSDMTRQGVDTSTKGVCAACDRPIFGKVINAMRKAWHPEHFACTQCERELASITFFEHNGRPYCEKDYHELFAPRCAYCNGPILERCMKALGKTWHVEHFFCTLCGKHFGPEGFHEKDSKAYCRECYYEKFAPRCRRCDKAIMEGFISALGAQWHPECFCCKVCGVTFPRGDYYDHDGEPHCEIHYHAQRGTLCAQCQKPITGKCVSAMGKKFHPDHFTCAFCLKLLNKGTFKEHRNNAYCQPCFIKLFG